MRHITALAAALMITAAPLLPAQAQDKLALGPGYYDINDNEGAADFRAEYRWDKPLIWVVKPWVGAEATSDGAVYAVGGILADMEIDDGDADGNWVVTPSFGAGLYGDGDGKDLGNTVEFRSQLEIGYEFNNNTRLTIAGGHISNAGLGDSNPGTEIVNLYYHIPVNKIFGRTKTASTYDYGNTGTASAYSYNDTAPAAGTQTITAAPLNDGPYGASAYNTTAYQQPAAQDTGAYGSAYGSQYGGY